MSWGEEGGVRAKTKWDPGSLLKPLVLSGETIAFYVKAKAS